VVLFLALRGSTCTLLEVAQLAQSCPPPALLVTTSPEANRLCRANGIPFARHEIHHAVMARMDKKESL
jgi:hypothetical protein